MQGKFDEKYGPTWHVIVGADFKAFVTHESKSFIFFYSGKMAVCIFKAG
jgi:dynein light chain LC8-type